MRRHNDEHRFVPGTRQTAEYESICGVVGTYVKPTLTEQGIDVDAFIKDNYELIQRLRKGKH